ncbi:MAG: cytochrome c biogenesis protein CcdA [Rhodospirillales bacterium]|nr:cytochrome c biogenesis protein CcdA [Alphaproteobacteria bacterium]MBL6948212.1 cytochrome c biogenesis protein CcdA [Rhodospirillales bacterium]
MDGFEISYIGALGAGILSFLSPCVLPLVPPYLCFLGGVSLEQMTDDEELPPGVMRGVLLSAVAFVLGFSTVFIALGATASTVGQWVADYLDVLSQVAGGIIIILGLHFMGVFRIPILYREARFHAESRPAGLIGPYIIGLAFAFGWTPCVGPVLAAILMVAGSESSITYGMGLLAVYSAGLGIPFFLAAVAMKPFMNFMTRFRKHLMTVERVIGALLVLTGILFVTGSMADISYWLLETFPALGTSG